MALSVLWQHVDANMACLSKMPAGNVHGATQFNNETSTCGAITYTGSIRHIHGGTLPCQDGCVARVHNMVKQCMAGSGRESTTDDVGIW